MEIECDGLSSQYLDAYSELRHAALSQAGSEVRLFKMSQGKEVEYTPETDVTRQYQDFEEVVWLERSTLKLARLCRAWQRMETFVVSLVVRVT